MNIKSIRAKNFFSIGEEPIFIDFTKCGNIVLIKGKNYDVNEVEPTSNGASKSASLIETVVYALYGKTIRNLSHADIINKQNKKGLEVEICFDNYRVLRTRKPDALRIWKDEQEITLGTIPSNQEMLDGIIKLNYNSFINIACFGQHNSYDFLSCTPAMKRRIVENLLSIENFNNYAVIAKEEHKNITTKIKEQKIHYENALGNQTAYKNKLNQLTNQDNLWTDKKTRELKELEQLLIIKEKQISNTDIGSKILLYEQSQIELKDQSNSITTLESNKENYFTVINTLNEKVDTLKTKENEFKNNIRDIDSNISRNNKEIDRLNKDIYLLENLQEGAVCSTCFSVISKENYEQVINHNRARITEIKNEIDSLQKDKNDINITEITSNISKILTKQIELKNKIKQIDSQIYGIKHKIRELVSIEKPDTDQENRLIQEQISAMKDKVHTLKHELNGGNPYKSLIKTISNELDDCEKKLLNFKHWIDELSSELPYYDYWANGFGSDEGIRSLIISDIIPTLNNRIAYYLNYLIDGKLKITFDNNLQDTIEKIPSDGSSFIYNSLSGGEQKRCSIAISQSFSYVMSVAATSCPNLLFLDEIADSIDADGVNCLYKLICELANERQIFIITHNPVLLDLLQNCDTITIVKKGGFSTIEESK